MKTVMLNSDFSGGIIAPSLWARVGDKKGAAAASNVIFDYRGGVKNRPGTEFMAELSTLGNINIYTFRREAGTNDYLFIFTANELRVMLNGAWLLSGGNIRVWPTSWGEGLIPKLRFAQSNNVLTVTAAGTAAREITLTDSGDITITTFNSYTNYSRVTRATSGSMDSDAAGTASFVWRATALIRGKGNLVIETLPSRPLLVTNAPNLNQEGHWVRLRCFRYPGAIGYRWYRTIVAASGGNMNYGQPMGFIGETAGPEIVDNGTSPDFRRTPPQYSDPFANGPILALEVTNIGAGYTPNAANITLTSGPGTGFLAYPVVGSAGTVIGTIVDSWGEGYTADSVFTVQEAGATLQATVNATFGPISGNSPTLAAYFQQRRVFAASNNNPNGIWGSATFDPSNFTNRAEVLPNEGFTYYIDIGSSDPIQHMLPMQDSLLLFHARGIHRLHSAEGGALTAQNGVADMQAAVGCGSALPVVVENDIVFASVQGATIWRLAFSNDQGGFGVTDLGVWAKNLMGQQIRSFAWQREPDKLLWVLQNGGRLRALTYSPEDQVFAWGTHDFGGPVRDIAVVREGSRDALYLIVDRYMPDANGVSVRRRFVERLANRNVTRADSGSFLDAHLASPLTFPTGVLNVYKEKVGVNIPEGHVYAESVGNFPLANYNGYILRAGGSWRVVQKLSNNGVIAQVINSGANSIWSTLHYERFDTGEWALNPQFTSVTGLTHLANQTVGANIDGEAFTDLQVSSTGVLTLPIPGSRVVVGLSYRSSVRTLPLNSDEFLTEHKLKRIIAINLRLLNTRGVYVGRPGYPYEPLKEENVFADSVDKFDVYTGWRQTFISSGWNRDHQIEFRQDYALPMEIGGYAIEAEAAA